MTPKKPLTIGLFTDNYGPGHSGLLYAVHFLEKQILDAGHKVVVVAPNAKGPNPYAGHPMRREIRLPSVYAPGLGANIATTKDFDFRMAQIMANPPDIIHVHGLGPIGMLGWWVADQADVPMITTWHTDLEAYADDYWILTPVFDAAFKLFHYRTGFGDKPRRWRPNFGFLRPRNWQSRKNLLELAGKMLEASAIVTTPSEKTAKRVLGLGPKSKVVAIPNGTDALPAKEPLPKGNGPRLLYVGRIAPEKGIPLLLDAFEWVHEVFPDSELWIVGNYKNAPMLRRKFKKATRRSGVKLIGPVPHEELGPYYESADIFAFPSLTDTQALVLHEAAWAGCALVLADSELRLVAEEGTNAMFAAPEVGAYAGALISMIRALEDSEFKAKAAARSKELAARYTIAGQSQKMIDLYEKYA